jgi:hypothetical protein
VAYFVIALSAVLGGASMMAFVGFLWFGWIDLIDLGFGDSGALWFDAGLCLAFFVQHSGLIRRSFRRRLAQVVRERYLNAVFSISSALLLLALVIFWQGRPPPLLELPVWVAWILRVVVSENVAESKRAGLRE